jgi:5'-3' exonuclease
MISGPVKDGETEIVIREVKNCPKTYDTTERVLLIDADSILHSASYFPEGSIMEFPDEESQIEEAKFRINNKLQEIQNNIEAYFNITNSILFVAGKGNFRYKIYPEYKTHRTVKNPLIPVLKQYIVEELGAVTADGGEADDYVIDAVNLSKGNCVIGAIDKDVLYHAPNVPFYDYRGHDDVLGEWKLIDERESRWLRACQLIIGDTSDNVKGAKKLGKAWCFLNLHENMTDYQYVKNIFLGYIKSTKGDVELAKKEFRLNYKLLKLHSQDDLKQIFQWK